ncbi:MAG: hypothetical protein M3Q95_13300 [Bacteroidota bacterium]|nr:hypothetical protein [Bacteroidota bacterium]
MIVKDVLFDSEFLAIYHEPEARLIHLKWKGFASSDNFRDGLNIALEAVKEHGIENWLGNLKLMESIQPADEEWASMVWFPQIAVSSLRKMAIVTSLDYFNNTSVKRIVNSAVPVINFETRYFVDVVPAKEWLIS